MAMESYTPASATVVNWDEALSIVGGKQELLCELVEIFLREGPRLLSDAERAHRQGDVAGLKIAAHTLKGSARYFGAEQLVQAAFALEMAAGRRDLDQADPLLARSASALEQLLPELRSYLAQKSRGAK